MKLVVKNSRNIFFVLAIVLAMPLPFPFIGGILWLSPFMFLYAVLATKSFVLLNVLGIISLVLIFVRGRFVCKNICPLGVVCDFTSKFNKGKRNKKYKLKNWNKALAVFAIVMAIFGVSLQAIFDPFNIFHMSFEIFRTGFHTAGLIKLSIFLLIVFLNLLFPNIWCRNICPLGGLQLLAIDIKNLFIKRDKRTIQGGRRLFLVGISGIVAGIALPKILKSGESGFIRPPAALPESDFNLVCARCGNCISSCPTNILGHKLDGSPIESFLTPVVDFSESYCLPECTACGDVCPSGAISKFNAEEKQQQKMAMAYIQDNRCLVHFQQECNLCQLSCKYDAIEFKKLSGQLVASPIIIQEKCVGCGACKIVCPEQIIAIRKITNLA